MEQQDGRSEKEKMLAGEYYQALDAELSAERRAARLILNQLNASPCFRGISWQTECRRGYHPG